MQTSVFHKKTYTGLLLNYFSFVPDSYKYGFIKTLIDCMYKINSTWTSFDIDLKNLKQVLLKNQYPLTMIDNVIKKYLKMLLIRRMQEACQLRCLILKQDILNFLS